MIVDLLLHGRSDLVNKLADLKRRSHFETDVVQQREKLTVPPLALVHASVLDRDGDLARQQIQQLHLIFAEITGLRAFNIEHSDDAVLADQWNRKFGTRVPNLRFHWSARTASSECSILKARSPVISAKIR